MIVSESFERFQYLNFETTFLENGKLFQKKLEESLLVQATKIEIPQFPFKTALLEANGKTNRMATTKWTHYKEWSFASNYLIFLENLFLFWNLLKRVNLMYQRRCFFPVSILKAINSFKIIMQLINPNYPLKLKQMKINQEKLPQSWIYYPIAKDPDTSNRVKMQQKLLFLDFY